MRINHIWGPWSLCGFSPRSLFGHCSSCSWFEEVFSCHLILMTQRKHTSLEAWVITVHLNKAGYFFQDVTQTAQLTHFRNRHGWRHTLFKDRVPKKDVLKNVNTLKHSDNLLRSRSVQIQLTKSLEESFSNHKYTTNDTVYFHSFSELAFFLQMSILSITT